MKKLIPTKKIPHSYERCFNDSCPQSHECLHHQAYQLTCGQRLCGPAIYPEAWAEGTCQRFTDSQREAVNQELVRRGMEPLEFNDDEPAAPEEPPSAMRRPEECE